MNLKDIPYERPDIDAACAQIRAHAKDIAAANTTADRLAALSAYEAFLSRLTTTLALGQLRYFLDTENEARGAEMAYIGQHAPQLDIAAREIADALLAAPDRAALERALGSFYFEKIEAQRRITAPENAPRMAEEQALIQRYSSLTAQATVEFEGKTRTLSAMTRFYADPSRDRRRDAMRAVNAWYEKNAGELDEIFDALIQNRTAQARALGFDSYTDYRYATRFGYGRREIERFRAQVRKTLVPLVSEIKNRQRERLGVESFRIYDSPVRFSDGNPKLKVKRAAFVEAVAEIFDALSPDAGGYFRKLRARGMLDLFDRSGKIPYAGFCLNLPEYDADVICARFSGDQSDFEILTHEFGHAYSSHRAAAANVRLTQREMPQEIAETHAKAMELFTMGGAEKVFDEADAKRYAIKQLEYIPYFITSICAGDEFQHALYDNPGMTPAQRNAAYAEIYAQYNPYLDLSDLPFESWGSQWQDTLVIYSMPFYYIDYALAQVLALALYRESRDDFGAAWARYQRFVDGAGTRALPDLAAHCGIPSPFADGAIEDAGALIERELGKLY